MGMRLGFPLLNSAARVAFVCTIAGASAACSSDAMRFTDTPFNNPFGSSARMEPQTTASVASAPSMPVQSQVLPPVSPVASAPLPAPTASASRVAMAAPVAASGAVTSLPGAKGWTTQGGSTVTVGASDTVKSLSNRYGVPEAAIRAANGLNGAAQPVAGTAVLIPVYNASATAAPAASAAVASVAKPAAAAPVVQQAAAASKAPVGSTRMKLVQGAQPAAAQVAAAVPAAAPAKITAPKVAEVKPAPVKVPEPKVAAKPAQVAVAAAVPAPVAAPPTKAVPVKPVATAKTEPAAEPVKAPAQVAAVKPAAPAAAPAATVVDATETTASIAAAAKPSTEFRWPAKGRIISGFGGKGGASNDGINISLPEGTPVKAAEGGTVAYAGNELKGYGNLVLIRHPDGWVSAYAHNGDLKVKRGDTVSRGQTIATSGASGNVSSPQLHFELRKGSTPVDPMPHLSGT